VKRTAPDAMDDELEKAQAQAMELLLQQCVAAPGDLQMTDSKLPSSLVGLRLPRARMTP
jgi:hypothetical protein